MEVEVRLSRGTEGTGRKGEGTRGEKGRWEYERGQDTPVKI